MSKYRHRFRGSHGNMGILLQLWCPTCSLYMTPFTQAIFLSSSISSKRLEYGQLSQMQSSAVIKSVSIASVVHRHTSHGVQCSPSAGGQRSSSVSVAARPFSPSPVPPQQTVCVAAAGSSTLLAQPSSHTWACVISLITCIFWLELHTIEL